LPINRCVPYIGNFIQGVKRFHHFGSNDPTWELPFQTCLQAAENLARSFFDSLQTDRPLFASFDHPAHDFLQVQRLRTSVALEYPQFHDFDLLIRGVTKAAADALAPTTDASSVLRWTGINHLIFEHATLRAIHYLVSFGTTTPLFHKPLCLQAESSRLFHFQSPCPSLAFPAHTIAS